MSQSTLILIALWTSLWTEKVEVSSLVLCDYFRLWKLRRKHLITRLEIFGLQTLWDEYLSTAPIIKPLLRAITCCYPPKQPKKTLQGIILKKVWKARNKISKSILKLGKNNHSPLTNFRKTVTPQKLVCKTDFQKLFMNHETCNETFLISMLNLVTVRRLQ